MAEDIDTGPRVDLSDREFWFLAELHRRGVPVAFAAMDSWATPDDSRARQSCRRKGLAETTKDDRGRRAWALTLAGRLALAVQEHPHGR